MSRAFEPGGAEDAEIGFDVRMLVYEINPEALRRSRTPLSPVHRGAQR